jgi:hypothetical protein
MTLDDPAALVLVARELAGRAAMVVRTFALDGFGSTNAGELAIYDRRGCRAGRRPRDGGVATGRACVDRARSRLTGSARSSVLE